MLLIRLIIMLIVYTNSYDFNRFKMASRIELNSETRLKLHYSLNKNLYKRCFSMETAAEEEKSYMK